MIQSFSRSRLSSQNGKYHLLKLLASQKLENDHPHSLRNESSSKTFPLKWNLADFEVHIWIWHNRRKRRSVTYKTGINTSIIIFISNIYLSNSRLYVALLKVSAYSLIDVVMDLVTQYIIMLSSRLLKVNVFVNPPSSKFFQAGFVHVVNFSKIYAAKPTGLSRSATPGKINDHRHSNYITEMMIYIGH